MLTSCLAFSQGWLQTLSCFCRKHFANHDKNFILQPFITYYLIWMKLLSFKLRRAHKYVED